MDVLQHRFSEALDVLQRHGLAVDKLLGVRRTHGDGACHAEGDPHPVEGHFILAEPGVNGGSQRGDIHGVAHGVLDVVAEGAVVGCLGDQDGGLNFALLHPQIHGACLQVEVLDGYPADAVFAGDLHHGLPCVEGGGGVGGGHTVAGIAADGTGIADLRAAHHIHRLAQHVDILLDQRIGGDVAEGSETADAEVLLLIQRHASHFMAALNTDKGLSGPLALPHLHQHIGAAGDDLGLGMLQPQTDGVLYAFRLIER